MSVEKLNHASSQAVSKVFIQMKFNVVNSQRYRTVVCVSAYGRLSRESGAHARSGMLRPGARATYVSGGERK